jgi:hypothetical protein
MNIFKAQQNVRIAGLIAVIIIVMAMFTGLAIQSIMDSRNMQICVSAGKNWVASETSVSVMECR